MKKNALFTLTSILVFLILWIPFTDLHAQQALHVHLNPVHIPGVNPFTVGLGYEYPVGKSSISLALLYTKMDAGVSGDGDCSGFRIVGDWKFPFREKGNVGMTLFPTYWKTTAPIPDEPEEPIEERNRIKWGVGAGIFKSFTFYKNFGGELIVGPEMNQKILYSDIFREVTYAPRLRMDFKLVWKFD